MVEHLFSGSALCAVDSEGTLFLPRFAQTTLARRSDARTLLVGSHECDPCLVAYDPGYSRVLHADAERRRIAEEGSAPAAWHGRSRRIFGFVEESAVGSNGRIALPPMMRRRARIGDLALLVGTGGSFEIWSPERALESGDPDLAEIAAWHLQSSQAA